LPGAASGLKRESAKVGRFFGGVTWETPGVVAGRWPRDLRFIVIRP
jgi:hypothetical protein